MQAQRLQTGLRLRDRNETMASRKCSYDSGRKYWNKWVKTFAWAQKAANGSVCKLWCHCIQSVQFHKS